MLLFLVLNIGKRCAFMAYVSQAFFAIVLAFYWLIIKNNNKWMKSPTRDYAVNIQQSEDIHQHMMSYVTSPNQYTCREKSTSVKSYILYFKCIKILKFLMWQNVSSIMVRLNWINRITLTKEDCDYSSDCGSQDCKDDLHSDRRMPPSSCMNNSIQFDSSLFV